MKIGDKVQIVKCAVCPKVVGKTGIVVGMTTSNDSVEADTVVVKFGKGRPTKNRPEVFSQDEVELF